jgi:hypothetical protein
VRHEAAHHPTESFLSLPDLVALLTEQQKTGVIVTVLSSLALAKKRLVGSYLAQVMVEQGNVCACFLTERDTGIRVLEGQAAFAALCTLEGVCWQVRVAGTPAEHRPRVLPAEGRQTDPLVFVIGSIPHRVQQGTYDQHRLSRQHLNVLRLIDGQRTTQQIAQLLTLTPEQLGTMLRDLLDDALIAFYKR